MNCPVGLTASSEGGRYVKKDIGKVVSSSGVRFRGLEAEALL